jgi:hypothetical protein
VKTLERKFLKTKDVAKRRRILHHSASSCELRNRATLYFGRAFGQLISQEDVEDLFPRKAFQRLLSTARYRFHTEIAEDPERGKAAKIGQLEILAQS